MIGWGWTLSSWLVAAAGVMAVIYAAGFAAGDEDCHPAEGRQPNVLKSA